MPIFSENGGWLAAAHTEPGYTSGISFTSDLHILEASVAVHVGLSRFSGTIDGPGGASIGISQYVFKDEENQLQVRSFADESEWVTALYRDRVSFVSISAHVHRGEMKGWWFMQVWV